MWVGGSCFQIQRLQQGGGHGHDLVLWVHLLLSVHIIITMSKQKALQPTIAQQTNDIAAKIAHKDEIKILKKKIEMLKSAVIDERKGRQELQAQVKEMALKVKKYEVESKKKEEKNEGLLVEIRTLKDALIVERNEKQKCLQELKKRDEKAKQEGQVGGTFSASNYFGLKGLFNK